MSEREEMKARRELENEIDKRIKGQAKKFGYKFRSPCAFAKQGEYFISSRCSVRTCEKAIAYVTVKKMVYDDVFWDVMDMPSNKEQPLSLRAVGAFTAPEITVCEREIPISSDLDAFVELYYKIVIEESTRFLQENPLDDYILTHDIKYHGILLKCLVYLGRNETAAAVCEAKQAIASGDRGGFENGGKNFFEWVLLRFAPPEYVSSPPTVSRVYQSVPIEIPKEKETFVNVDVPDTKPSFLSKIKTFFSEKNTK